MIVIKIGGAAGIDPQPLLAELADLAKRGEPWILVHGGNEELSALQERLGTPPRFVRSPSGHESRITDAETIAAIQMSYRGRINNDLVLRLQRLGCDAVGLSGVDGGLWRAKQKPAIRIVQDGRQQILRGDRTGRIHTINTDLLRLLLGGGYHPVVTLPALSDEGEALNVDGDRAAAQIAAAMGARTLLVLSRVPGLLEDPDDPNTLVPVIARSGLAEDQRARGRFKKKLLAAQEALDGGVPEVRLGTTETETPIASLLAGNGTVIS